MFDKLLKILAIWILKKLYSLITFKEATLDYTSREIQIYVLDNNIILYEWNRSNLNFSLVIDRRSASNTVNNILHVMFSNLRTTSKKLTCLLENLAFLLFVLDYFTHSFLPCNTYSQNTAWWHIDRLYSVFIVTHRSSNFYLVQSFSSSQ